MASKTICLSLQEGITISSRSHKSLVALIVHLYNGAFWLFKTALSIAAFTLVYM